MANASVSTVAHRPQQNGACIGQRSSWKIEMPPFQTKHPKIRSVFGGSYPRTE